MKICYVDEAGCCGMLPDRNSQVQPVLVIGGLIIDYSKLHEATHELLHLKSRFYPGASPPETTYLGRILGEVKGADIRRDLCGGRRASRTANGFVRGVLDLCDVADVRLVGRVWIKKPGAPFAGRNVYASSLQAIAQYFHDHLARTNDLGFIVADSRSAQLNAQMSHSIFTKKFKSAGDDYDRIIDLPTFGHSDNHAGLQIIDLICSALIFPMAVHTYCAGHMDTIHHRPRYDRLKSDYAARIEAMQHRYVEASGRWNGGMVVSDAIQRRSGRHLFYSAATQQALHATAD